MKNLRDLLLNPVKLDFGQNQNSSLLNQDQTVRDEIDDLARKNASLETPGVTRKIQKFKRSDFAKAKLLYIGYPRKRHTTKQCKRRFGIQVEFLDEVGKNKKKLVLFGKEGKDEYVDHKDNMKRLNTISKMAHEDNWLHPNFYKLYLLNSRHDNIPDAYRDLVQNLELEGQI